LQERRRDLFGAQRPTSAPENLPQRLGKPFRITGRGRRLQRRIAAALPLQGAQELLVGPL
jgi:hypothetical protein